MTHLPETTVPKSRRKNSCPDGWLNAGAKVPIRLTVRQEEYCRQAMSTSTGSATTWPSGPTGSAAATGSSGPAGWTSAKAFNAGKREDHPFVTRVAALVATGAFRDFGQALDNKRRLA